MEKNIDEKKRIPIKEGLWKASTPKGIEPSLVGSRCRSCGELFFPKKEKGFCINCQQKDLEDFILSRMGKIGSFTVVMQQPGGGFYKGPVPYAYGYVDLPEGISVETLFVESALDELKIGMDVELIIEKLAEDNEGNEIITYKFKPIKM